MNNEARKTVVMLRPEVRCKECSAVIFDGLIIKSRVVRVLITGAEAKCKRCREWVRVPLQYRND